MCTVYLIHLKIGPSGLRAVIALPRDLLCNNPRSFRIYPFPSPSRRSRGAIMQRRAEKVNVVMVMLVTNW